MRSALADFREAERDQDRNHLIGLERRNANHALRHGDGLNFNEFEIQLGIAVFRQHRDDLTKVLVKLIQGLCLGVRARKPWHIAQTPYVSAR